jgi:hypothetical protein
LRLSSFCAEVFQKGRFYRFRPQVPPAPASVPITTKRTGEFTARPPASLSVTYAVIRITRARADQAKVKVYCGSNSYVRIRISRYPSNPSHTRDRAPVMIPRIYVRSWSCARAGPGRRDPGSPCLALAARHGRPTHELSSIGPSMIHHRGRHHQLRHRPMKVRHVPGTGAGRRTRWPVGVPCRWLRSHGGAGN